MDPFIFWRFLTNLVPFCSTLGLCHNILHSVPQMCKLDFCGYFNNCENNEAKCLKPLLNGFHTLSSNYPRAAWSIDAADLIKGRYEAEKRLWKMTHSQQKNDIVSVPYWSLLLSNDLQLFKINNPC